MTHPLLQPRDLAQFRRNDLGKYLESSAAITGDFKQTYLRHPVERLRKSFDLITSRMILWDHSIYREREPTSASALINRRVWKSVSKECLNHINGACLVYNSAKKITLADQTAEIYQISAVLPSTEIHRKASSVSFRLGSNNVCFGENVHIPRTCLANRTRVARVRLVPSMPSSRPKTF